MDFLKAEIERKKRQIAEKNVMAPDKKYFKRGDLAAVQEKEYLEKYGPKRQDIEDLTKTRRKSLEEKDPSLLADNLYPLPRVEVIRRLREKLEPILLWGESEDDANLRLRSVEIGEGDSAKLKGGAQNDYKEAMKSVDKQFLQAIHKTDAEGDDNDKNKLEVKLYETTKTYDDLLEMMNDLHKGNIKHDELVIWEFIKVVMTMWGHELNSRPDHIKLSVKGKMEAATYAQTRGYMKPLLRMLKKNALTEDIRDSLTQIVKYTLQRDYILANDKYLEMAIGNAPWPIGVTNAGIHARPGRERIFSKHVAHVLNDETQRKYIQGLKRLLSKCQQYYKTDPSRSVDFIKTEDDDD